MTRVWPNGTASIPTVTSEWGYRIHPITGVRTMHHGIDLVGFTYVCSSGAGVVSFARYNGGAGNEVRVNHDDGTQTRYFHNKSFIVREGQRVSAGTRLAVMGTTGASTGVHCHFQTHPSPSSASINPRIYMTGFNTLPVEYIKSLQRQLGVEADGQFGPASVKALQTRVGVLSDGIVGPGTISAMQSFIGAGADGIWGGETTNKLKAAIDASKFGTTFNPTELLGADHVRRLQAQLGELDDGIIGPATVASLQHVIGVEADGIWGPATISALQSFVGAAADGIWGSGTTASVRAAIEAGRFFNPAAKLGADYVRKLQEQLGVTADGIIGVGTTRALQRKIGAVDDGIWGPATVSKLQAHSGAHPDGLWGVGTTNSVRATIDAGGFVVAPKVEVPTDPETPPVTHPDKPAVVIPAGAVYGIDVAWPQTGEFHWPEVETKFDFIIIKAAGGEDGIYGPADLLDKHLEGARTTSMRVGFYFFNNNRHPIKEQADKFIETLLPRIQPGDFVALDIEDVGSHPVQFNPEQALEFADYVEDALGIKTLMYMNRSSVNNADWSEVVEDGHPLWLATLDGLADGVKYLESGSVRHWGSADVVQFSHSDPIPGYPHGAVDQNIGFPGVLASISFAGFPEEPEEPDVEAPADPSEPPTWFRRFLEGLIVFFRSFLGGSS